MLNGNNNFVMHLLTRLDGGHRISSQALVRVVTTSTITLLFNDHVLSLRAELKPPYFITYSDLESCELLCRDFNGSRGRFYKTEDSSTTYLCFWHCSGERL